MSCTILQCMQCQWMELTSWVYRWWDKCLFTTNARDWFINTLECIMPWPNMMRAQTAGQKNNEYCYDACACAQRHYVTSSITTYLTFHGHMKWVFNLKIQILRLIIRRHWFHHIPLVCCQYSLHLPLNSDIKAYISSYRACTWLCPDKALQWIMDSKNHQHLENTW